MTKTRLEAFSDGMFAIILTILVLELHVPELENASFAAFRAGMVEIAPKFFAFLFSFFIIAIFWINHHAIIHQIHKVDTKLLWLNIGLLFFSSLFPFITAFIGDYMMNPFVVALYPLNMTLSSVMINALWKHAFVDTDLAPNTMTDEEKRARLTRDRTALLLNLGSAALAFVWVPITLFIMAVMPFAFVVPEFLEKKEGAHAK
ncbi:MAG TPA: TMEM175 family protein [Anaerolineales bacterium]|nr:TMEM175 family protein [Anaerolineales bacterium]